MYWTLAMTTLAARMLINNKWTARFKVHWLNNTVQYNPVGFVCHILSMKVMKSQSPTTGVCWCEKREQNITPEAKMDGDAPLHRSTLLDSFTSQTKHRYRPFVADNGAEVYVNIHDDRPRESGYLQLTTVPRTPVSIDHHRDATHRKSVSRHSTEWM